MIFLKLVEEFIQQISTLKVDDKDDALCASLRAKLILTESNTWNYMAWDAQAKCLRPTNKNQYVATGSKRL